MGGAFSYQVGEDKSGCSTRNGNVQPAEISHALMQHHERRHGVDLFLDVDQIPIRFFFLIPDQTSAQRCPAEPERCNRGR